jgi:hypothetical protein
MGAALELNFDRQRFGRSTSLHHSCSLMLIPGFQSIDLVQERISSFLHK